MSLKKIKFRKPSRLELILSSFIVVIGILAFINMDFIIGSFWHATHSSQVLFKPVKVKVPFGWLPIEKKASLSLVKYPKDGSVITVTKERVEIARDPKEAIESIGWTFMDAEDYFVDDTKGIRITSRLPGGEYDIGILLPERELSISYLGPEKNIPAFDDIVAEITFIKSQ